MELSAVMDAGTWVAIAAVIISLVALYFSRKSTVAAERAATAAEEQTKLQRQLRIEAAQPYVWADVRPDEDAGTLLNLVVGNSGPTVARNVRVRIDPPMPTIDQLRERVEAAHAQLAEGIGSLGPGSTRSWPLGQGFNLIPESGPETHTLTVTAEGPFDTVSTLTYTVDLADFRGTLDRPKGNLHQLTRAVRELGERFRSLGSQTDALAR
jgi:hypothetical protein